MASDLQAPPQARGMDTIDTEWDFSGWMMRLVRLDDVRSVDNTVCQPRVSYNRHRKWELTTLYSDEFPSYNSSTASKRNGSFESRFIGHREDKGGMCVVNGNYGL